MRKRPIHVRLLALCLMSGVAMFTSCNDNDYDFNEIDATIGIGGDKLEIPVSSTDVIKLADVLELEADGCVVEEANGDYVFRQDMKNPVPAVHPNIGRIILKGVRKESHLISFYKSSTQSNGMGTRALSNALTAKGRVLDMDYKYDKPA